MWVNVFAIFVCLIAVLSPRRAAAAVVPTAPTSIPLTSLLGSANTVVAGPFTFNNFSLQVQSSVGWETGPASLAAALSVRPMTGNSAGLELAGTTSAASLMSAYPAVAVDYQLGSSTMDVGGAASTLFAVATSISAAMSDRLVVTSPASSNTPLEADTSWSGASPTAAANGPVAIQFLPSTALAVTDIAAISPAGASNLSFAIDTVFVPEPGSFAIGSVGCFLLRRWRAVL